MELLGQLKMTQGDFLTFSDSDSVIRLGLASCEAVRDLLTLRCIQHIIRISQIALWWKAIPLFSSWYDCDYDYDDTQHNCDEDRPELQPAHRKGGRDGEDWFWSCLSIMTIRESVYVHHWCHQITFIVTIQYHHKIHALWRSVTSGDFTCICKMQCDDVDIWGASRFEWKLDNQAAWHSTHWCGQAGQSSVLVNFTSCILF